MKTILSWVFLALTCVLTANAQGTLLFLNNSTSPVYYYGQPVTSGQGVYVDIVWAPLGTQDWTLFQRVPGDSVQVGVPFPGRFAGGTRTIPAGTGFDGIAPGAVVSCIVRAWFTSYGADFESVTNSYFRTFSDIFTVDTGDPTTVPAEIPGFLSNLTGLYFPIPEPGGAQLATLALFAWFLRQSSLGKNACKLGSN